jgi:hypothetical protein
MIDDQIPSFPPEMQTGIEFSELDKEKILVEYKKRPKREY